jgi:hypothetical protein
LVLAAILSLALHVMLAHVATSGAAHQWSFYFAPARAWEFLAGALAAIAGIRGHRFPPKSIPAISWGAAGAVVLVSVGLTQPALGRVAGPLIAVTATTLLLMAGETAADGSLPARLLRSRALTGLGDVSYSWYLWHWPFIVFAHATWPASSPAKWIAAIVSLLPAWLSTRYVEQRFRYRPRMSLAGMTTLVAVSVLVPVAAAVGLRQLAPSLESRPDNGDLAQHIDEVAGCNDATPIGERASDACVWNPDGPNGEMLLIGDSNAGHFSEAALVAAQEHGLRLRIATLSSCPFLRVHVSLAGRPIQGCERFVSDSLRWITEHPPKILVMASASDLYLGDAERAIWLDGAEPSNDVATKSRSWITALSDLLGELGDAQIPTLLLHPVPKFGGQWSSADWSTARYSLGLGSFAFRMSRSEAAARQAVGLDAEQAALTIAGAEGLDVFNELCPTDECTSSVNGTWWYRDWRHISTKASVALGSTLSRAVGGVLKD